MARPVFVGLDLETTAGHQLGRICQVGVAFNALETFCEDVNPGNQKNAIVVERWIDSSMTWPGGDAWLVETAALKVNGFDSDRMAAGAPTALIDTALADWLHEQCERMGVKRGNLIPVGYNISGFDMPFVNRELPQTASFFSRRTVDLNALCFALGASSQFFDDAGMGWEGWKKRSKRYASQVLGTPHWHDAGFDATAALLMFLYLHQEMRPDGR